MGRCRAAKGGVAGARRGKEREGGGERQFWFLFFFELFFKIAVCGGILMVCT